MKLSRDDVSFASFGSWSNAAGYAMANECSQKFVAVQSISRLKVAQPHMTYDRLLSISQKFQTYKTS